MKDKNIGNKSLNIRNNFNFFQKVTISKYPYISLRHSQQLILPRLPPSLRKCFNCLGLLLTKTARDLHIYIYSQRARENYKREEYNFYNKNKTKNKQYTTLQKRNKIRSMWVALGCFTINIAGNKEKNKEHEK